MAHCDPRMSDQGGLPPPAKRSSRVFAHDRFASGSGKGLGCSSNGEIAACTYNSETDSLVVYKWDGTRLWSSGRLLKGGAFASAPLIGDAGSVIAADGEKLIRFGPRGEVLWITRTPGGLPISPVPTASGSVFLATAGGPVSAYSAATGRLLGSLAIAGSAPYDTVNTPCAIGNRLYISMQQKSDLLHTGRLVAIDTDKSNAIAPLRVAWTFEFGAPSGASPSCIGDTVYFDGYSLAPGEPKDPHLFAVRDDGTHGTLLWARPVPDVVTASLAADPRGGLWVYSAGQSTVQRRYESTGLVIESLDVNTLIDDGFQYAPSSALTINGTKTQPVLHLSATNSHRTRCWVLAVDLVTRKLLWKINLAPALGRDTTAGQFPVLRDGRGNSVLVFTGWSSGAYFVAEP